MRGAARHRHVEEEEEESVFVSMTDMTVSFLFVVMILLAFFASQLNREDVVPQATHERILAQLSEATAEIWGLNDRILELENLLREQRLTIEELRRRLATVKQELLALRERLLSLEQALSQEQAAHSETRRQVEAALARIVELEARIEELERPDPLEGYLSRAAVARLRLLQQLRGWLKLDFPDLQVVISAEGDALRFQGEGLFRPSSSTLRAEQPSRSGSTTSSAATTLGLASTWDERCNPGLAVIEAVQIEGHTDADGSDLANLALSTTRANATFAAMLGYMPGLVGHLNTREQPVLSVAGYGEMRPVAPNDTAANKSTNRRIDLRIIMHTPVTTEELLRIRDLLSASLPGDGP